MPQIFNASISVELPENATEMAAQAGELITAWSEFLGGIANEGGVTSQFSITETRAKPTTTGAKRGRKPRATPGNGATEQPAAEA